MEGPPGSNPQHSPSIEEVIKQQPMSSTTSLHLQSPGPLHLQSPGPRDRATGSLFDGHELRTIVSHLAQALTPRWSPNYPRAQCSSTNSHLAQAPTPRWSPNYPRAQRSSSLYDSFELRAVANQLDRTLRAAQYGSPLYSSPNVLRKIYRNRSKKLKQVAGPEPESKPANVSNVGQSVQKIWKKLKRAFRWRRSE